MGALNLTERSWIALSDGRRLSYSVSGPKAGFPVVYLHGAIGAPMRRDAGLDGVIRDAGIRYVVVDRPGFGDSDPSPDAPVAAFARDMEQLADALGLERFSTVGVSAGGPYALACAWRMAKRVSVASAVSSIPPNRPPHSAPGTWLRYRYPLKALARAPDSSAALADRILRSVQRRPELIARFLAAGATDGDDASLAEPASLAAAVRRVQLAIRHGAGPSVHDYVRLTRPWGFEAADILARVVVWHGGLDRLVAVRHALAYAEALPAGSATVDPLGGHFFFRHRIPEILGTLIPARQGAPAGLPKAA
jgi:pimeloyl-ACP methyl ester carboxylesterase